MSEVEQRALKRVGATIKGKYTIDKLLGLGGMAVVYAATHRNRKRFAIKMLHPELSLHEDVRNRFLREGYTANTVDHPGAVAVLDDDVAEDGAAFIVMELLAGHTVEGMWDRSGRRMDPQVALGIVFQLLDVLAAAHEKNVVHRDIKPANLFVTREGAVKVLDFGIARLREMTDSAAATRTGMMMGTPAFMPPEQAMGLGREIDGRTDLWAAGATLFTLLSGAYVHEAETPNQMVIAAATKPARSLATAWPEAPSELVELVARALAFDKKDRFADAREMHAAVERVHRAMFDAPPSLALLARAVASDGPSRTSAPSPAPKTEPIALAKVQSRPTPPSDPGTEKTLPSVPPAAATASPVSATVGKPAPRKLIYAAPLALLLLGGGAWLALRKPANADPVPTPPASTPIAATKPPAEGTNSIAPLPTPSVVIAPPPETATASTRPRATAVASARVGTPTPSASASVKTTPSASTKPAVNCDPPFTIGANGKRVYKPECM